MPWHLVILDAPEPMLTLHRYFLMADTARQSLHDLPLPNNSEPDAEEGELYSVLFARLTLWWATLYVVLDGCKQVELKDDAVHAALKDPRMGLLQDARNAALHFRPKYLERRLVAFMISEYSDKWAFQVHEDVRRAIEREAYRS